MTLVKGSLEEKVNIILTRRDIMLLKLCVNAMAHSHARGTLGYDLETLRSKLEAQENIPT